MVFSSVSFLKRPEVWIAPLLLTILFGGPLLIAQDTPASLPKRSQQELAKIVADSTQAISKDPQNATNYYNRGLAEYQSGKLVTLNDDADHSPSREEMESFTQYRQYMKEAIGDFSKAIELNPRYSDAYLYRGLAELEHRSGDIVTIRKAKPDILRAVELDPQNPEVYRALAQTETDREKVIQDYSKAIDLAPLDSWTFWKRGRVENWAGHCDNAAKDFAEAIRLNPKAIEFYHSRAEMEVMLANSGQTDWSVPIPNLTQEIELNPNDPGVYTYRAFARERVGDWKGALQDYDKELQIVPSEAVTLCRRGYVKQTLGDNDGALSDFSHAGGFFPSFFGRGAIEQGNGDMNSALVDLHAGLQASPLDGGYANLHIWIVQMLQGKKAAADQELSDYLAKTPAMYLGDWIPKVAALFLGRTSEADFLSSADKANWEAWYYAGCRRLALGDKATAYEYLGKCSALKKIDVKVLLVHGEMENLGKSTGGF